MSIVRRDDRPVLVRGPQLPTLQRLVDRAAAGQVVISRALVTPGPWPCW